MTTVLMIMPLTSYNRVSASVTPSLTLTSTASLVNLRVIGAEHNAIVKFSYPNYSANNTTVDTHYTSIDIGSTDSNGAFTISVAPNSYGLSGGMSVYVSVNGTDSTKVTWPATWSISGQNGLLALSKNNVSLTIGQGANIFADNTVNTLLVQGNSNPSVVSATIQANNNSMLVTGLNVGSSVISVCAGTAGCGTVNVSVRAPTQSITFSQVVAYVVAGQPAQNIGIYGPGFYDSITNTNKDAVSASVSGTSLVLKGLIVGQSTVSVCAAGYLCGSIVVHSLAPGSAIPTQPTVLAPVTSGFNQPPQLSSVSISSNNVLGLFFGAGSTISINFGTNETVTNVQVRIGGVQTAVSQGSDGLYYASYRSTGKDIPPLPLVISFTNARGLVGQSYLWVGNSSKTPSGASLAQTTIQPAYVQSAPVSETFTRYLYSGMTAYGVLDPEVRLLQERLKSDGLFTGVITGYFGTQTKAAVQAYQKKFGLSVIGVVGPATREQLNKGK